MVDYNIRLKHQPGTTNKADHLSQQPDYDQGDDNNRDVMALSDCLFANVINLATLQEDVCQSQKDHPTMLHTWKTKYSLTKTDNSWYNSH